MSENLTKRMLERVLKRERERETMSKAVMCVEKGHQRLSKKITGHLNPACIKPSSVFL